MSLCACVRVCACAFCACACVVIFQPWKLVVSCTHELLTRPLSRSQYEKPPPTFSPSVDRFLIDFFVPQKVSLKHVLPCLDQSA